MEKMRKDGDKGTEGEGVEGRRNTERERDRERELICCQRLIFM